jgi:bleomycin hydrolase
MKRILFLQALTLIVSIASVAQNDDKPELERADNASRAKTGFTVVKQNPSTPIKNQANTGTCWSFSTTSLIESQLLKNKIGKYDLSEMFTVRNIYLEKAHNYLLRQGHAQFGEGALGHDVIRSIATYGAVPETVYAGLKPGETMLDHSKMVKVLKQYLDSMLKSQIRPIPADWQVGYKKILDEYMGPAPENFKFNGQRYSPQSFASDVMKFKADDYVQFTSFTNKPYYQSTIIDVPDNFSNGAYYNLPLQEMIDVVKSAVTNGYTVMWDADVSNSGFSNKYGLALLVPEGSSVNMEEASPDMNEDSWNETKRQSLYETLVTQDDHLMHITGIEKSKGGKLFFIVKNSWGTNGVGHGFVNVSESYFAINTISLVLPKAAVSKALLDRLK